MGRQAPRNDAVVFSQSRGKLLGLAAIGVGFVSLGLSFILYPDFWASRRHSPGMIDVMGWVVTLLFSLCLIAAVTSLVRPAKVYLAPKGLSITTAWRSYYRPWDAVSDFKVLVYKRNRTVVFNDNRPPSRRLADINRRLTGATSALPTALDAGPDEILAAVEAAKERWGGKVRSSALSE